MDQDSTARRTNSPPVTLILHRAMLNLNQAAFPALGQRACSLLMRAMLPAGNRGCMPHELHLVPGSHVITCHAQGRGQDFHQGFPTVVWEGRADLTNSPVHSTSAKDPAVRLGAGMKEGRSRSKMKVSGSQD